MSKWLHRKKSHLNSSGTKAASQKTSFAQAVVLVFVSIIIFLGALEGLLALTSVQPVLSSQDPFVGFTGNVPLYEEYLKTPDGHRVLSTSKNKMTLFNRQVFSEQKKEGTYRVFCLGGSTTYGRPYDDSTSFSAWLRELLPEVQNNHEWEVINAGGISYASYRVARLMEELVQYDPDLFIIYTGQNEFLEERTYRDLKKVPEVVRSMVGLLARTRTWTFMTTLLDRAGISQPDQNNRQPRLASEVNTILDNSTGPRDYHRDDDLRDGILEHYRVSLERMVEIAEQSGVEVIFVTPASNLKDSSPFKSEHTSGLDKEAQRRSEGLLKVARISIQSGKLQRADDLLNTAIEFDPRYAELHYIRGKALLELGRYDDALLAFKRARDEDVCPLRALTPMEGIIAEIARQKEIPLVDFVEIVQAKAFEEYGHRIPGEELFLDHVHPSVDGHKLLAVALLDKMVNLNIVQPMTNWNKESDIATVTTRIESRIDPNLQAMALINLSKVLHWAGKAEEAERSAKQALRIRQVDSKHAVLAINQLIKLARVEKDWGKIDQYLQYAITMDPWSPMIHHQMALRLVQEKRSQEGFSHALFSRAFWDTNQTNSLLGLLLYQRGRYALAYPFLERALEQNPGDKVTRTAFESLKKELGSNVSPLRLPEVVVERSATGLPRSVFIQSPVVKDKVVPAGAYTEWNSDGTLERYAEYAQGIQHGTDVKWDKKGQVITRILYERGEVVKK